MPYIHDANRKETGCGEARSPLDPMLSNQKIRMRPHIFKEAPQCGPTIDVQFGGDVDNLTYSSPKEEDRGAATPTTSQEQSKIQQQRPRGKRETTNRKQTRKANPEHERKDENPGKTKAKLSPLPPVSRPPPASRPRPREGKSQAPHTHTPTSHISTTNHKKTTGVAK